MIDYISWICAATTLTSVWFSGSRKLLGPLFGVIGFLPWTGMAIGTEQWGLIPLNVVITILQGRALWLWKKEGLAWA